MIAHQIFTTSQLGDAVILTGAVRNVRAAHPEIKFTETQLYPEVWRYNPDIIPYDQGGFYLRPVDRRIDYGEVGEEQRAMFGNVVEAFTRNLCRALRLEQVPCVTRQPVLFLDENEIQFSQQFEDAVLINANCQTSSISKGYPHWQKVADGLKGYRLIQIGGNCKKDLTLDLEGVEDWRGKTTVRQLMAMIHGCKCVVSPPSAPTNIAAAFSKPQVIINASREPDRLTDYPNARHISHRCRACGWGYKDGCISLHMEGSRTCGHYAQQDGRLWCGCQWETRPETIIKAIKAKLK